MSRPVRLDAAARVGGEARRGGACARGARRGGAARARRCSTLADRVRRWHALQRPADVALEVEPGVVLERRWVPLDTVGIYVPRGLVSTLVMCAVPAQVAGVRRIVVCTPPSGAGARSPRPPRRSASTRSGRSAAPQAIACARLRRARRQDRRPRQRVRERGEARGLARRADRPARRAVRGRRRRRRRRARDRQLELAAQAEHGPDVVCRRRRRRLDEAEALAPEHLVLLGDAEALTPIACATPARSSSGPGRRSPRATTRPAATTCCRRAAGRARSAGSGWRRSCKPVTVQRLTADGLGALRPTVEALAGRRGHARARGGGPAMRALAPTSRRTPGRRRPTRSRGSPGIDPSQVLRFDQNTPPLPLPSTRPGTIAGALARVSGYPGTAATASCSRGDRATTRASSPRTSCSARAPTT